MTRIKTKNVWVIIFLTVIMVGAIEYSMFMVNSPVIQHWISHGPKFGPAVFNGYYNIGDPIGYNYLAYMGMTGGSIVITPTVGFGIVSIYFVYTPHMNLTVEGFTIYDLTFDNTTQAIFCSNITYTNGDQPYVPPSEAKK